MTSFKRSTLFGIVIFHTHWFILAKFWPHLFLYPNIYVAAATAYTRIFYDNPPDVGFEIQKTVTTHTKEPICNGDIKFLPTWKLYQLLVQNDKDYVPMDRPELIRRLEMASPTRERRTSRCRGLTDHSVTFVLSCQGPTLEHWWRPNWR